MDEKEHTYFDGRCLDEPEAKAERSKLREAIGVILCIAFVAAVVGLYSYSRKAHAGTEDCESYAKFAEAIAVYRDVEANREKVIQEFKRINPHIPPATWRSLEREALRVWAEQRPREDARDLAFRRCIERLGDMGTDS